MSVETNPGWKQRYKEIRQEIDSFRMLTYTAQIRLQSLFDAQMLTQDEKTC